MVDNLRQTGDATQCHIVGSIEQVEAQSINHRAQRNDRVGLNDRLPINFHSCLLQKTDLLLLGVLLFQ